MLYPPTLDRSGRWTWLLTRPGGILERARDRQRRRRRILAVVAAGVLAVAAAVSGLIVPSGSPSTPGAARAHTPSVLTHVVAEGTAYAYPASWFARVTDQSTTTQTNNLLDLSTQPIVVGCRPAGVNSQPTPAGGAACIDRSPTRLTSPGVYVNWYANGNFGRRPAVGPGHAIRIGKVLAMVEIGPAATAQCLDAGGQETVRTTMWMHGANFRDMSACLRGPGLGAEQRQITEMIKATRDWTGRTSSTSLMDGPQSSSANGVAMTRTQMAAQVLDAPVPAGQPVPIATYAYATTYAAAAPLIEATHTTERPTAPVWVVTTQFGGSVRYTAPAHPTPVDPASMVSGVYDAVSGLELSPCTGACNFIRPVAGQT